MLAGACGATRWFGKGCEGVGAGYISWGEGCGGSTLSQGYTLGWIASSSGSTGGPVSEGYTLGYTLGSGDTALHASSACTWRSSVLMRGVWRGVRRVSETRDGRWHCTASGHAREVDSMQMRAVAARRPAATDRGVWRVLVRRGAEAVAQTLVSLSQRRSARREGVWRLRHCTFEGWLTCDDACGACGTLRLLICGDWQSSRQEWRAKRACRPAKRAGRRRIEDRTAATWKENLQNPAVT